MFLDVFSEYVRLFKVPQDPAVDLHVPHHGQKLDVNCPSLDRPDPGQTEDRLEEEFRQKEVPWSVLLDLFGCVQWSKICVMSHWK